MPTTGLVPGAVIAVPVGPPPVPRGAPGGSPAGKAHSRGHGGAARGAGQAAAGGAGGALASLLANSSWTEWVTFPCQRWFSTQADDCRISRVLFAGHATPLIPYTVRGVFGRFPFDLCCSTQPCAAGGSGAQLPLRGALPYAFLRNAASCDGEGARRPAWQAQKPGGAPCLPRR